MMKELNDIFEIIDGIIPEDARKTVIFCEIEKTAYEIFYYSYFSDDTCKQSFELVDEGLIDSGELDSGFEKIAHFIRKTAEYQEDKRNVVSITIEGTSEKVDINYFDKSTGLYKIKKEWKTLNL